MNLKINRLTVDFVKRQAKKIAKQQNIPYHKALNLSAINVGFKNWNHFVNESKKISGQDQNERVSLQPKSARDLSVVNLSKKVNPYRNLLVASVNKLLDNNCITLTNTHREPCEANKDRGHLLINLLGFSSVLLWQDIGFDELRISVWWKYNHTLHPQANLTGNFRENFNCSEPLANRSHYKKFVGVVASAWLERKSGKYIQGKNGDAIFNIYTRAGEKLELEKLPLQIPKGFEIEGKFHL